MERRDRILGHPIHQVIIVLPLGLLPGAIAFDAATLATGNPQWSITAFWLITTGVLSALIAAMFGVVDWLAIPHETHARTIGARHGLTNLAVMALFIASWFLRLPDPGSPGWLAVALTCVAMLLAVLAVRLGGQLVDEHGVGIPTGGNLDAPGSPSRGPSAARAPDEPGT